MIRNEVPRACGKFDLIISHISHMRNIMLSLLFWEKGFVPCLFIPLWNQCAFPLRFFHGVRRIDFDSTMQKSKGTWGYWLVELNLDRVHYVNISYNNKPFWLHIKNWVKTWKGALIIVFWLFFFQLIILIPYTLLFLFFLIISSKRKREKIGGTIKTSNAMRSFSLVNFGPRCEPESVLDTAPNT